MHREGPGPAVERAVARVEGWIATRAPEAGEPGAGGPGLLEGARRDADGVAFTRRLLEAIVDVNDPFTAALGLRAVSQELPPSLPARDRLAVRAGGLASLGLPWAVLPVARRWLRDRVGHLVLSCRPPAEGSREARTAGFRTALRASLEAGGLPTSPGPAPETMLALGGDPVLGPQGAEREVERLVGLASQPEVAQLGVDPARIVPAGPSGDWALDADAESGARALRAVVEAAQEHGTAVVLEPSDYRGALLAPELIARLLAPSGGDAADSPVDGPVGDDAGEDDADGPPFAGARLGMRLPAELPESHEAAERLIALSRSRVAAGGEAVELTVGIAGLSGHEQIASVLTGLAVPSLEDGDAVRAQLLRLVSRSLAAGADVRTVVATEDPLLLAAATLAAEEYGSQLTVQLRAGTAAALSGALAEHGFAVRTRLPVVAPKEFAGAVEYLIRLAIEAADPDSALARAHAFAASVSPVDDTGSGAAAWRERGDELARALELADGPFPASHRVQLRGREWHPSERDSGLFYRPPADAERLDTGGLTAAVLGLSRDATGQIVLETAAAARLPVVSASGFANEPDTDAAVPQNREWARGLLERAAAARAAEIPQLAAALEAAADPEALVGTALVAAEAWRDQRPAERAVRVGRLALGTASARDRLIEVLAAETGGPVAVLDAEVSGAVDAARYLGQLAAGLGAVRGAEFQADRLALVVADADVPLAERAEAVLAALAAGSAVLLVAHPASARSSAALIEEWQAAGLPVGVVALAVAAPVGGAHADERPDPHSDLAAALAADPRVDRALVLGRRDTARAVIRRRPDLPIEGRFRTLGSTLIAPSAEPGVAVREAVRSAFAAAPGDPQSARALVLLGSAARSKRLRRQLADAVRGLRVGDTGAANEAAVGGSGPSDAAGVDPLAFDLGPLPEPPDTAGLRALTELQPGEEWLVEPERLDDEGRLWRPGVRVGLRRGARFWADAVGMPVIGVIAAGSLDEAIALQNELGGGSAAGLHASDPAEILPWLENVRAASLAVGRPTTGARVERRPGGGWGAAGMGAQPLAGGPNRLVTLGSWRMREGTPSSTLHLRGLDPEVQALIEIAQASLDYASFDRVRRAALADALAWRTSLGRVHDAVGLGIERNLLRHRPVGAHVRLAEGGSLAELVRVIAAGMLVGAPLSVSVGGVLPPEVARFLADQGVAVSLERDEAWLERIAVAGAGDGAPEGAERVRLIGGDPVRAAEWLGGRERVPLWAEPVTMAGPVELLAFLREQSISVAAHRHGLAAPPPGVDAWAAELDARAAAPGG